MKATKSNKKEEVKRIPPITIENAKIVYRNFSGDAKKFNAKGLRNFHVVLNPDFATQLEKDGWNVKWQDPREEGDTPLATIKVAVRFDNIPPRILMITSGGRTLLDEDTVGLLDTAEILNVDLMLTPFAWEVSEKKGIKAYLKKMFITLDEGDLEVKHMLKTKAFKHNEDDD